MTVAQRRDPLDWGRIGAVTSPIPTPTAPEPAGPADGMAQAPAAEAGQAPGDAPESEAPDASPARLMTMDEYNQAMVPRSQLARARGLAAPYIPGGRDPDIVATKRAERPYLRLLALMVIVIVGGGFLITIAGFVAGGK